MNAALANEETPDIGAQARENVIGSLIEIAQFPDIRTQERERTLRRTQEWFDWMYEILDIHRSNFVFREATPEELEKHKTALKLAIRTCLWINALIADPDFDKPDLVSRLNVRTRQLEDAYSTFHGPRLSEEETDQILRSVFPE